MKRLRILPGAAGIIALTATIGFVDGQRKIDAERFSKGRITLVKALTEITAESASPGNGLVIKPDISAYLVEIKRGDTTATVLIDAVTGQRLAS